jgi:glycosyltransferase involved in cell wall biosynthesis
MVGTFCAMLFVGNRLQQGILSLKLIILRDIPVTSQSSANAEVLTLPDLKKRLKNWGAWRQLFRYSETQLYVYQIELIPRPFFWALILRALSHGRCSFADEGGQQQTITLSRLVSLGWRSLQDRWQVGRLLQNTRLELAAYQHMARSKRTHLPLDLTKRPFYLRTDIAFGLKSGGSIGHIAGVLNNLEYFGGKPIFISTDTIPTVDPSIQPQIPSLSHSFWSMPEFVSLAANPIIETFARQHFNPTITSFIYQRYSLNNYTGVKLALDSGLPFVLEYNGSEVWIRRNWGSGSIKEESLSRDIEILNFQAADLIVVVSDPLKEELLTLGIPAEKILVNPNGVDPDAYSPSLDGSVIRQRYGLEDKVVVGFIGTFGAWHGAEVLAEAYGKLLTEYPEYRDQVRLLLIGDGLKMPEVKANLNKYGVMDYAVLTGIVPQKEGAIHLAACDLLIASHVPTPDGSKFFGSPTKLFEYMAMGKGIVASNLDQIGEILEHGRTAWMVTPGDADDLMRGIKHLVDHPKLRAELGKNARQEAVENYTWYEHTRKIIDRLKALVG